MAENSVFQRILVPPDFSSGSENAWRLAQRMGTLLHAELLLLHVLPATPLDMEARLQTEERNAAVRALQAYYQLGIPRADDAETLTPLKRVYEGPLFDEAVQEFSPAGRVSAEQLEQWGSVGRAAGCKVRTFLRVGLPYLEIVEAASEESADLVLLATHGRGGVPRLLVGSVADRVIRMAPCPVLTVKA